MIYILKKRIITSIFGVGFFILILFFFKKIIDFFIILLLIISIYELFKMYYKKNINYKFLFYIIIINLILFILNIKFILFKKIYKLLFFIIFLFMFFLNKLYSKKYEIKNFFFLLINSLYINIGFSSFIFVKNNIDLITLIYFLFLVWSNDIGAYFIGKKFGKKKIFKYISPNKSLEGCYGGIFFSLLISTLFFLININVFKYKNILIIYLITIILAISGQIGDLIESYIKRILFVKNSSNILPGHGGILDRFDSFLFVFIIIKILNFF